MISLRALTILAALLLLINSRKIYIQTLKQIKDKSSSTLCNNNAQIFFEFIKIEDLHQLIRYDSFCVNQFDRDEAQSIFYQKEQCSHMDGLRQKNLSMESKCLLGENRTVKICSMFCKTTFFCLIQNGTCKAREEIDNQICQNVICPKKAKCKFDKKNNQCKIDSWKGQVSGNQILLLDKDVQQQVNQDQHEFCVKDNKIDEFYSQEKNCTNNTRRLLSMTSHRPLGYAGSWSLIRNMRKTCLGNCAANYICKRNGNDGTCVRDRKPRKKKQQNYDL